MKISKAIVAMGICCLIYLSTYGQEEQNKGIKGLFGNNVETEYDKFEGTTTHRMTGNKVKIDGGVRSSIVKGVIGLMNRDVKVSIITTRLQLENHILKDNSNVLSVILNISVEDDNQFSVGNGESLIFLVDGERIGLSTEGFFNNEDNRRVDSNLDITKSSKTNARYRITEQQLIKIIKSKEVLFRILQDDYSLGQAEARDKKETTFEGSFSQKNFKAWTDFYENYIIETTEVSGME